MKISASRGALALLIAGTSLAQAPAPESGAAEAFPAGATFVFTAEGVGRSDLWLQRGLDAEARNLTRSAAQDHVASWFPDGTRIAFQSSRDGQREIYVLDLVSGEARRLTDDPAEDLLPDVSADGRQLAFFSDRGLEHGPRELPGNLYVMSSEGGAARRVTRQPLTSTFGPDWSPDGALLLTARDFDGDIDLLLVDPESGDEQRLPGTPAAEYGGRFSPDGQRIAFHSALDGGEARIVVMNRDGSARRELTHGAQHFAPHWSPDGRWLMFTGAPLGSDSFDLLAVPSAGGEVRPVVATERDERSAAWSPAG